MQKDDEDAMSELPPVQNSGAVAESSRETKRSRRSLRALEKQATDLYSFLSELEEHKSAGPEKLKEFLNNTDEKPAKFTTSPTSRAKSAVSPSNVSKLSPRESGGVAKRSEAKSPTPPVRKDSVKRLENARSKYISQSPKTNRRELEAIEDTSTSLPPTDKSARHRASKSSVQSNKPENATPTKKEASEKKSGIATAANLSKSEQDSDVTSEEVAESENIHYDSQSTEKKADTPNHEKPTSLANPSRRHRSAPKSTETRRSTAKSSEKQQSTIKPSEKHDSTAEPPHNSTPKNIETPKEAPTRTRARRSEKPRDTTVRLYSAYKLQSSFYGLETGRVME